MKYHVVLGMVIGWAGALIAFTCASVAVWVLVLFLFGPLPRAGLIVGLALLALLGQRIFRLGRRISQESPSNRLANDQRAPVLLLRAFSSDGEVAEKGWLNQRSLVAWLLGRPTFEEELAHVMEDLGPPVALGRRGELIPTFGFSREYADDAVWRLRFA